MAASDSFDAATASSLSKNSSGSGSVNPESQESMLDRKRPVTNINTSFTSSFGRPPAGNNTRTEDTPESFRNPGPDTSRTHASSTTSSRRPTGSSQKPSVRNIVSWLEHKKDTPDKEDSGGPLFSAEPFNHKLSTNSSFTSSASDATQELSHDRQRAPTGPHTADHIPTTVPGTEDDDLTFLEYQQFFSRSGDKRVVEQPADTFVTVKKKSYGDMTKVGEKPGSGGLDIRRRAGQDFTDEISTETTRYDDQDMGIPTNTKLPTWDSTRHSPESHRLSDETIDAVTVCGFDPETSPELPSQDRATEKPDIILDKGHVLKPVPQALGDEYEDTSSIYSKGISLTGDTAVEAEANTASLRPNQKRPDKQEAYNTLDTALSPSTLCNDSLPKDITPRPRSREEAQAY